MKKTQSNGFILVIPAVIIGIAALVGGTVAVAQVSLPDSPLYGIKTATEHVRIAIALSDTNKAKTHVAIAANKLNELKELSEKNVPVTVIEKAASSFEDNESKAERYVENKGNSSRAAALNKILDESGTRNQAVLDEVYEKVPEPAKEMIKKVIERSQGKHATSSEGIRSEEKENAANASSSAQLHSNKPITNDR